VAIVIRFSPLRCDVNIGLSPHFHAAFKDIKLEVESKSLYEILLEYHRMNSYFDLHANHFSRVAIKNLA
jgi:hypothetical protein